MVDKVDDSTVSTLFKVIESLWLLSTKEEDFIDLILDILINWNLSREFNKILFSRIVNSKGDKIMSEIYEAILCLDLKNPRFAKYMRFLRGVVNKKEIRNSIYKTKILDTLTTEFINLWKDNVNFTPTNPSLTAIISFLHPLSFYQDSHRRIVVSKDFIPAFTEFISLLQYNQVLRRSTLILLTNLCLSKLTKNHIISNPELLLYVLSLVSDVESGLKLKFLSSQFLVNFLHKNGAGVEVMNKQNVVEELSAVLDEVETVRDRNKYNEFDMLDEEFDSAQQVEEICRGLIGNIRFIVGILKLKLTQTKL